MAASLVAGDHNVQCQQPGLRAAPWVAVWYRWLLMAAGSGRLAALRASCTSRTVTMLCVHAVHESCSPCIMSRIARAKQCACEISATTWMD